MTQRLQTNYTKEILTLLRKFSDPQQISQPGHLAKGLRTQREFDFGGQWDLSTELTEDWETNKTLCHQEPGGRSSTPPETDPDLPVSVQVSLEKA